MMEQKKFQKKNKKLEKNSGYQLNDKFIALIPARSGSKGLRGLGVEGARLSSMGGGKTSGSNKMEREIVVPTNSVPGLIAVDLKNMHVLHSKSTFNIVDAI